MRTKAGLGAFFAAALLASPAYAAVTVANQDAKSHTVVVNNGAQEEQHDIAAGQSIQVKYPTIAGSATSPSASAVSPAATTSW